MVAIRRGPSGEDSGGEGIEERKARRDALPEHTHYADTGCDVHPSCLSCPLVRCRYDEPGGARKVLSEKRDRSIILRQRRGETVTSIARRFGVSRRTVFRALARSRAGTSPPGPLSMRGEGVPGSR